MGQHSEYNGGPVISIGVERRTSVAAGLAPRGSYLSAHGSEGYERDRLEAVVRELGTLGAAPPGANVAIASSIARDGDLAAGAALAVALAKALSLLAGRRLASAELASVAVHAERGVSGSQVGRTDPMIVIQGQRGMAFLLESAWGGIRSLALPARIWVLETGVGPGLADVRLSRRRECAEALAYAREFRPGLDHLAQLATADLETLQWRLPPPLVPRVRHVVIESAGTRSAAAALAAGDLPRLGRLMVEGHESLRVDYEATCEEADFLVGSAVARGAYGARLTGAGWRGAVVMLAPPASEARILAQVSQDFQDRFGRVLQVWNTRAAGGVRREVMSREQVRGDR